MLTYEHQLADGLNLHVWHVTTGRESSLDAVCEWLSDQRGAIDEALNRDGALLIRGIECLQGAEDFDRAIRAVAPELRDYVGGTSPREKVHGRIMTATSAPPPWSIPLHQEMAYTLDPPDRIAFFCAAPATGGGGANTLGDMAALLGRVSPDVLDKLTKHGIQLRRTLPSEATMARKPGVKNLWKDVFDTSDRDAVDEIASAKGWQTKWLDHDTLQLWQDILPATKRHPVSGREVWFNQAHLFAPSCMMAWALRDGRQADWEELDNARRNHPEMLDDIFCGNGQPVTEEEALHLYEVVQEAEVPVTLQRSDLLILDNTLVAHGRAAFSGERTILVALINVPAIHETPSVAHDERQMTRTDAAR